MAAGKQTDGPRIRGAGIATAAGLYPSNLIMPLHFPRKKNTLRLVRARRGLLLPAVVGPDSFFRAMPAGEMTVCCFLLLFMRKRQSFLPPTKNITTGDDRI